eukprot:3393961-Rhodomonas_salina.1
MQSSSSPGGGGGGSGLGGVGGGEGGGRRRGRGEGEAGASELEGAQRVLAAGDLAASHRLSLLHLVRPSSLSPSLPPPP